MQTFFKDSLLGTLSLLALSANLMGAGSVNFAREIRPILSNNCFHCHGPDDKNRKGNGDKGLRLDTAEGAFAALDSGFALVAGHPEKSSLLERILSHDKDEVMPPPKTGKKLTPKEVDLLRRWIQEGAVYSGHWAYIKPVQSPVPEVTEPGWNRSPVDRFLFSRLQAEGLRPGAEADRETLVRRVALDLTGLPPSLEEVDTFKNDTAADAYGRLVDRFLAKSSFGEHWARVWMDLARYADSAGYPSDPGRSIWAFRDYVVRAFNSNKPFDQFTIEQLAGDLLPDPTEEQIIATAFHRNTMTNNEGGTSDEEFRNSAVIDRVNTTWSVWMGTSMACAQCHTHKFDPLTQNEYFGFFAILNQTEDADRNDEAPLHQFLLPEEKARKKELEGRSAALEALFKAPVADWKRGFIEWDGSFPRNLQWENPAPSNVLSSNGVQPVVRTDGSVLVPASDKGGDNISVQVPVNAGSLEALQLTTVSEGSFPGSGASRGANGAFIVDQIRVSVISQDPKAKARDVKFRAVYASSIAGGFEPQTVVGLKAKLEQNARNKGWSVSNSTKAEALTLIPEKPVQLQAGESLRVELDQRSRKNEQLLASFALRYTLDSRAELAAATPSKMFAVLKEGADARPPQNAAQALDYYVRNHAPEAEKERTEYAAVKRDLEALKPNTVPILRELPADKLRVTKVQLRGNYLNLGDEVHPGTPAIFPPMGVDAKPDRLAMARWLVSPENPLTARVIANRFWESIFGVGIVRTSEEFGAQGEMPVHPELLDWLALELIRSGWDVKAFLKTLLNTAAYRQSSAVTAASQEKDPENRLLARGPRFRMSAEILRDQALFVSGLLSPKMFGKPVRPPKPNMGLSTAFGKANDWEVSAGEDKFRRALYTEVRRNSPYPSFTTFDAPNREVCTLRRNRTNTPLQALVTLNDPVFIEAAQALARKAINQGGKSQEERIRYAFRCALSREPSQKEVERLGQLIKETGAGFEKDLQRATQMATDPLGALPSGADAREYATWTVVSNVLLNLDEALMRR
jgi:mono/diheme cytochrome c family protein